ncbi:glycosyltransferase family 4 protein [Vibrio cortegadensis]|uniref:Glycosyltransferase family 4 protein n=1 Tax=Vibrio cortegadensis TaxID=1328770 RepID=A0ABV4M729_9VIBR
MHICHVNLATGFSGGERQNLVLIKHQIEMGYDITVVAHPRSPFYDEVEKLPCRLFPTKHFLFNHRRCITNGCTVMHVHEGRAIYWAYIQKLLFGTQYIITRRIDNPLKNKRLSRMAYADATHITGVSNKVVEVILDRHPDAKCSFIPDSPARYPYDPVAVQKIRERFDNKFLIIKAAKMYPHKGFDVAINAAKGLQSQTDIHFALLGDGPEEESLHQLAHDIDNVSLVGNQPNIGDWFKAADLLIHTSYTEGMGSVILEAMAAGLPVIGSKAGGIPDVIQDSVSGLLFDVGDAMQLSQLIQKIKRSDELYEQLKLGAKNNLIKFEIETTAQEYEAIYQQIERG